MSFLNTFFFDVYPYIASAVFFIGSWIRYDYAQYTWRAGSSQMLTSRNDKRYMRIASNLFHVGILGIFAGHFVGMLTPHWMYAPFITIAAKQQLAMIAGGACGLMTVAGGAMLLKRRLTNSRVRATSSFADIGILTLLVIQACLGVLTIPFSAQHMDGSEMMKLVGGTIGDDVWRGFFCAFRWGRHDLPSTHRTGYDHVLAIPVLPFSSHLERASGIFNT